MKSEILLNSIQLESVGVLTAFSMVRFLFQSPGHVRTFSGWLQKIMLETTQINTDENSFRIINPSLQLYALCSVVKYFHDIKELLRSDMLNC